MRVFILAVALLALHFCSTLSYRVISSPKSGIHNKFPGASNLIRRSQQTALRDVPLELTGQLDPSKKWDVKFIFEGEEKVVSISEDTSFLDMGEKLFDGVPSSCRNGICTTCAGQVVEGRDKVKLAVHGLGVPQIAQGFICSCQAYATGPGIVVKLGMYDQVYESQYGQYEKSYEMKFGKKEEEEEKPKKKGWFG